MFRPTPANCSNDGKNRPSTLLYRFASPEEVANLCVYVASLQVDATTGVTLCVTAGIVESIA